MTLETEDVRVGGQRGFSREACIFISTFLKKQEYITHQNIYTT